MRFVDSEYPPDLVDPLLKALADELRQQGAVRSPAVYEAFRRIPRHCFLPSYFEQQGTSLCWQQRHAPEPASDPAIIHRWLQTMYANRPLTTLVDQEGMPISSSSMPSIMGTMLEALQIEPGMNVLEIGTGTGYNAALLACLVGANGHVTTIDLNADLIEQAKTPLEMQTGSVVSAFAGDGTSGWKEHAPYHRIIATGRSTGIWDAWLDQLTPGGRLVLDMGGSLAGGLLVAELSADSQHLEGSFLPLNVSFMRLQSASDFSASPDMLHAFAQTAPARVDRLGETEEGFSPLLFKDRSWRFFLQWHFPTATLQWWGDDPEHVYPVLFDPLSQTMLRFTKSPAEPAHLWSVQTDGPAPLWEQVRQAFQAWHHLGRPGLDAYRLMIERGSTAYDKRLLVFPAGDRPTIAHSLALPLV